MVTWRSLVFCFVAIFAGCSPGERPAEVVVYSSVDEAYSRPVCREFEKQTGIRVKLVTDTEAAKSTGLVLRLKSEREAPVADVFWSGDLMRPLHLAELGLADKIPARSNRESFARIERASGIRCGPGRLRLIVYHRPSVDEGAVLPESVLDLSNEQFAPLSCIANPLFGTTSMHAAALLEMYGEDRARRFFEDFARNGGRVLSSNGEVKRRVGNGEFRFGLTDSDDANLGILDGNPLGIIVPDQDDTGALFMPTAIMRVRSSPNPENADRLVEYLSSEKVAKWMAESTGAHFPLDEPGLSPGRLGIDLDEARLMEPDYSDLGTAFEKWRVEFLEGWVREVQR